MIIRNSEVTEFLRCRLRWNYRWNRRLEPKKKSTKLMLGTLFHKFLQEYYQPKFWHRTELDKEWNLTHGMQAMKQMYDEEVAAKTEQIYDPVEADEMCNLLEGLARWYHEYWSNKRSDSPVTQPWEVVATEQTYYINMRTLEWTTDRAVAEESEDIWYECTLDLVIRIDGRLYIVDHKTVSQLETFIKKTEMDRQISRYIFAANVIFKEEIHGLIYNLIKKELPHPPKETKKGLSVAKDQRTTYGLYLKALIDKGLATVEEDAGTCPDYVNAAEEYIEMLQNLAQRETAYGNDFLQRIIVKRNKHELNNAMNEFMQVAHNVKNVRNFLKKHEGKDLGFNNPIYRNITNECSWDCGFKSVCMAAMDGSDVKYLEDELLEPIQDQYETEAVE